MFELNLPKYDIRVKMIDKKPFVWDTLRRKYVSFTSEEVVRQHFVNYLINYKHYPKSLIANETQIILNGQKKRCDSVVYSNMIQPLVIIEYKSPEVKITQEVFNQIARYNLVLRVKYLIVSNGLEHYCCSIDYDKQTFNYLEDIPDYKDLR